MNDCERGPDPDYESHHPEVVNHNRTFEVTIKDGPRYTLWNVTMVIVDVDVPVVLVKHSDRPDTLIHGVATRVCRREL